MFTTDRVNAYFFLYIWVFSRFAIYGFTASAVTSFSASGGAGSQCAATLVVPLLVPHMGRGVLLLGASSAIAYCTNASRGLSAITEVLVSAYP